MKKSFFNLNYKLLKMKEKNYEQKQTILVASGFPT